jgi:integrase
MKMTEFNFSSIFAEELRIYINEKMAAGFKAQSFIFLARVFDRFCNNQGLKEKIFTVREANEWLKKGASEHQTSFYSRINFSKNFLRYLSLKGYDVYVVRDVRFIPSNFKPHIYTKEETERYFKAVDNYSDLNRKNAIQYPVLFRILYCCGTRISETLSIRKKDIDLDKGIIYLNETKNSKQRYVVVGDDLLMLLNRYADKCFYLLNDEDYIFSNIRGGKLTADHVYEHHRLFLKQAGIPYVGNNYGPRLHDWRHHMAVYAFKQLSDSGMDMYVALPILSTYLGHKTIYATEKYVRLTIELFPQLEEKFKCKVADIFGGMK